MASPIPTSTGTITGPGRAWIRFPWAEHDAAAETCARLGLTVLAYTALPRDRCTPGYLPGFWVLAEGAGLPVGAGIIPGVELRFDHVDGTPSWRVVTYKGPEPVPGMLNGWSRHESGPVGWSHGKPS